MSSPFHVDGEFSPLRALVVAVLSAVVLAQIAALVMVTRGQVLQAARRHTQPHVVMAEPVGALAHDATPAPDRMLVAGGAMQAR